MADDMGRELRERAVGRETDAEMVEIAADLGARAAGRGVVGDEARGRLAAGTPPPATTLSRNILLLVAAIAGITALVALAYSSSFRAGAGTTADSVATAESPHPQRPAFLDVPPRVSLSDTVRRSRPGMRAAWTVDSLAAVRQEDSLVGERAAHGGGRGLRYRAESRVGAEAGPVGSTHVAYARALVAPVLLGRAREPDAGERVAAAQPDSIGSLPVPSAWRPPAIGPVGDGRMPERTALTAGIMDGAPRVITASGSSGVDARWREPEGFLAAQRRGRDAIAGRRWQTPGDPVLSAGTVIPAAMLTDLNSDLPGDIVAVVTRDVFDSPTQRIEVIPRGARLVGTYDNRIVVGQHRLLVAWTRLLLPDGRDIALPGLQGTDDRGASGLVGSVDTHLGQQFGDALLLSLLGAGVELSQPTGGSGVFGAPSAAQVGGAALGQQLSEVALELVRRHADVLPTITVPLGSRFNVYLNHDVMLGPTLGAGASGT